MRGYEICPSFPSRQKTRASNLSSRRSSSSPAGRYCYCPKPRPDNCLRLLTRWPLLGIIAALRREPSPMRCPSCGEQSMFMSSPSSTRKICTSPGRGQSLCKHLAGHGVEVTFDKVQAKGRAIGDVLEAFVVERSIDLMVMGAYGHSRLREFILGGATKHVLTHPFTWTLVSH